MPCSYPAESIMALNRGKPKLVDELQTGLKNSRIVTPDSEDYAFSIQRWSEVAERRAVSLKGILHPLAIFARLY